MSRIHGLAVRACAPALVAAMLVGCSDPPTAPRAAPVPRASVSAVPDLIPNSVKYRDRGHKPGTGRSGSATLTVLALLGSDGKTDVELVAGSATGHGAPDLAKVQIKLFTPAGEHLLTKNDHGVSGAAAEISYGGLVRNSDVQVQANIRGIDGPRTDVVTASTPVKLRPDLAVTSLDAPTVGWTHTPTIITATIAELNGDLGARTTCVLDVGGVPVDSAAGIWVDAGDDVACSFAYQFTTAGNIPVVVRVARTDPGDFDPSNDVVDTMVEVRDEVLLSFSATASSDSAYDLRVGYYRFGTAGAGASFYYRTFSDSTMYRRSVQHASLWAYTTEPTRFPQEPLTDVYLKQESGGGVVHEVAYDGLAADQVTTNADSVRGCVWRADASAGVNLSICSTRIVRAGRPDSSFTLLTYGRTTSVVTYQSRGFRSVAYGPAYPCCMGEYYSWNTTTASSVGRIARFGSSYTILARFNSGFATLTTEAVIPLSSGHNFSSSGNWYPSCPWWWGTDAQSGRYGIFTSCYGTRSELWFTIGSAASSATP
jgi:hypothetical protein